MENDEKTVEYGEKKWKLEAFDVSIDARGKDCWRVQFMISIYILKTLFKTKLLNKFSLNWQIIALLTKNYNRQGDNSEVTRNADKTDSLNFKSQNVR